MMLYLYASLPKNTTFSHTEMVYLRPTDPKSLVHLALGVKKTWMLYLLFMMAADGEKLHTDKTMTYALVS